MSAEFLENRTANIHSATKATKPCNVAGVDDNCSDLTRALTTAGHPLVASFSFAAVAFNFLILGVIYNETRAKRGNIEGHRTQARVHLSCLALSDIIVAFVYIFATILDSTCSSLNVDYRVAYFTAWVVSLVLAHNVNRWLTLYITFQRAKVIWGVQRARNIGEKTLKRIAVELCAYGILGSLPLCLVCAGLIALLNYFRVNEPFSVACMIVYPVLITVMSLIAIYILIQTDKMSAVSSEEGKRSLAEFQNQVAVVAIAFCACQFVSIVRNGILAFNPRGADLVRSWNLDLCNNFLNIFNSTINIFIYLVVSKNFRKAFVSLWKVIMRL